MADGSRHGIYLIKETTYGVMPNSPNWETIRNVGTTLGLSKSALQSDEIRSDRQIADFRHGAKQVGGDVSGELSLQTYDDLLESALMGAWVVDSPVDDTDRLVNSVTRQSFSIMRHFSDMQAVNKPYHLFNGCEVNSWNLKVDADAKATTSFSFIGKGMSASSSQPSSSTYNDATTTSILDSFTGSILEGGVSYANISAIDLTVENGLEPRFVLFSDETILPNVGDCNVTGTMTAYFEDSTLIDKFINEISSSLEFEMIDLSGKKLKITLPKIKYNGGQPDVSGKGAIVLSIPFQAMLDPVTGSTIMIDRTL